MVTPVLVIGESGEGKSSMFGQVKDDNGNIIINGLPPTRTCILNTENKSLPFDNFKDFHNKVMDTFKKLDGTLDVLMTPAGIEKYDYVVLDSFTSMTEIVERLAEYKFQGFDQWKNYNSMIRDTIVKIKKLPQQVFVIAIPEQKDIGFNQVKSYARVKGKELKYGHLEKEFAVVLYTNVLYDDDSGEMDNVELMYRPNKNNTAKAPVGLFKSRPKNDALIVAKALEEFYGTKEETTNTATS